MNAGAIEPLHAIWGSTPDHVHAAGSGGTILRYDGRAMDSGTSHTLGALWGTGDGAAFVACGQGTTLRYDE